MSPAAVEVTQNGASAPTKKNIGVFTNPKHDLWMADAEPTLESVQAGSELKEGEVTVAIRSTGICGSVEVLPLVTWFGALVG
jgi:L-iditol 2-dehydrogenase